MYIACEKHTTSNRTKIKYCKIRLWYTWNIIYNEYIILLLGTLYDVGMIFDKKNWIDMFYNILLTNVQTKSES